RFALQGYMAIAPDLLSRFGTPTSQLTADQVAAAQGRLSSAQNPQDIAAALDFMRADPRVNPSQTAAIGFCFRRGRPWALSTIYPDLVAAAPFYGVPVPSADLVPNIRAAVLANVPQMDLRTTNATLDLRDALEASSIDYQINVYGHSAHPFFNDLQPTYNDQ